MKETTGTVGALLLAAGFSRRFGDVKLRARLHNGTTVFAQTLARLAAATPNILVVTRTDLPEVTLTVEQLGSATIRAVTCPDSHLGMAHTLSFGISRIPDWDACLVCLGDMPFIGTATYQQLLESLRRDVITLPRIEGQIGNPVGFGSLFYAALCKVQGDTGGREVVQANRERVQYIAVTDRAVLQDIDTPDDLARLQL